MHRLASVATLVILPALPPLAVVASRTVTAAALDTHPVAQVAARAEQPELAARPLIDRNMLMFFVAGTLMTFTLRRGYQHVTTTELPSFGSANS